MDNDRLRRRVAGFTSKYWAEIEIQLRLYPDQDIFPDFLKGQHRTTAIFCTDGIVAATYASEGNSFEWRRASKSMKAVVLQLSDGVVQVDYGPKDKLDLHLAEAKVAKGESPDGPLVWRSAWQSLAVTNVLTSKLWSPDVAILAARTDVLTFVQRHLMNLGKPTALIEARQTVLKKLSHVVEQFVELLAKEPIPSEEEVQQFIADNPILLEPSAVNVYPKFKLGAEHVPDFVVELPNKRYVLVEIEWPGHPLFNKKGDPSQHLVHAQRQVEDWRRWVQDNAEYARSRLPGISDPEGWAVLGRRRMLTGETLRTLAHKNDELHRISIKTYDDLIDRSVQTIQNLKQFA